VTTVPLIFFAAAVRRLRLATVGLLQYISPSLQFALGVLVYREPMSASRMVAFVLIWIAFAVYVRKPSDT
jgi:chloramphenicol-sensitive protein RarD